MQVWDENGDQEDGTMDCRRFHAQAWWLAMTETAGKSLGRDPLVPVVVSAGSACD